ncbi:MAG: hypothetical protein AAFZ65_16820 [Planctomycetota bacterium]
MAIDRPIFIAQGGFARLREIRRLLQRRDVEAEIVGPPDGKTNT